MSSERWKVTVIRTRALRVEGGGVLRSGELIRGRLARRLIQRGRVPVLGSSVVGDWETGTRGRRKSAPRFGFEPTTIRSDR